jgi:hypothetical protein
MISVAELGGAMIDYLAKRYCGDTDEDAIPMIFIHEYVEHGLSDQANDLEDEALCGLFHGITTAVDRFPQWCDAVYRASFIRIDADIRKRTQLYPRLRENMLRWIAGLARFRPMPFKWNLELLEYFGDPYSPDHGIPALEISALIFSNAWNNDKLFPDQSFCEYFLGCCNDCSFERRLPLLRCLHNFLQHVAIPNRRDLYVPFFRPVFDFLDNIMTNGGTGHADLEVVVFRVMDWFLGHGMCSAVGLDEPSWWAERRGDVQGRFPFDATSPKSQACSLEEYQCSDAPPPLPCEAAIGADSNGAEGADARDCGSGGFGTEDACAADGDMGDTSPEDDGDSSSELEEEEENDSQDRSPRRTSAPGIERQDLSTTRSASGQEGCPFSDESEEDIVFDLRCMMFQDPCPDRP